MTGQNHGWTAAAVLRRAAAVAVFSVIGMYAAESLAIGYEFVQQLRLPRDFDRRTRLDVLADLRTRGVDAIIEPPARTFFRDRDDGSLVSAFTMNGREFLPLGAVAERTTVVCNEDGTYLITRSDQYGFNNPPAVWLMPRIAVAAVGDSFTYGVCVDTADSFVGRIRRKHPATINLGITSFGPLFELATLKEYLPAMKPALVLWVFFENDIEDLQFERKSAVLMRYVREDGFTQNLRTRQAEIDRTLTQFLGDRERQARQRIADANRLSEKARLFVQMTRIRNLVSETRLNLFGEPDARALTEDDWTLFDEVLANANNVVKSWGGRMHFVYLPTLRRFGTPIGIRLDFRTMIPREYADRLHARVLQIARSHALPITDVTAAFEGHKNARRDLFSPIFHYTREGNRLVADAVLADLSRGMIGQAARARHDAH